MFDTAMARRMMVDGQVRTADVTNLDLIAAMLAVPRELFVPQRLAEQAYSDGDIPLGGGRALLKPMVLAKLIQGGQVSAADHVLDVGCGTGYASAVLSHIAGSVVALEEEAGLASRAEQALAAVGVAGVTVAIGRLTEGWPGGRAIRFHSHQRRHRDRARGDWSSIKARRPAGLCFWTSSDRQSHDISAD